MNRVEELIQQLCPNGVEWKKLGEIGTFYSGLSGKTKKDFEKGNAKYVTYSNIFNNVAVNLKIDDVVNVLPNEKQNIIAYGDIIFTGSSETPDECGMSSVVTEIINEPIYLNSFCFGFRLNNLSLFEPSFAKFLFRSNHLRNSIKKTANGVTRYNISKQLFSQIEIPIPPLPIQQEIVRILDTFTELTANLQTELDARKKQYAYYRDCLLNFEGVDGVEWKKLGEIGLFYGGLSGKTKKDFEEGNAKYVTYSNIFNNIAVNLNMNDVVNILPGEKQNVIAYGDVIFTGSSETPDECGMSSVVTEIINEPIYLNSFCFGFRLNNLSLYEPGFLKFLFRSNNIRNEIKKTANGVTRYNISKKLFSQIEIPIPPLPEQRRIVAILDKFETLVNDLSVGLPAELEARRKQYEYYRDKLLTFDRV